MISYKGLGYAGRLGNQMFQYAALLGIANKLGFIAKVPIESSAVYKDAHYDSTTGTIIKSKLELLDCFNVTLSNFTETANINTAHIYQERFFHFDENVFKIKDSTDLHGYYQSEKYFQHCSDLVKQEFTFKSDILAEAKKIVGNHKDTVAIHVRRGDYLGLPNHHPAATVDYYSQALEYFTDREYTFICFSDDIPWCEEVFCGDNIIYSNSTPFVDLCCMSMCDHNIIANSSFSWWGAWLNSSKSKKVIAPSQWFGPAYLQNSTEDLYCKNWIII